MVCNCLFFFINFFELNNRGEGGSDTQIRKFNFDYIFSLPTISSICRSFATVPARADPIIRTNEIAAFHREEEQDERRRRRRVDRNRSLQQSNGCNVESCLQSRFLASFLHARSIPANSPRRPATIWGNFSLFCTRCCGQIF